MAVLDYDVWDAFDELLARAGVSVAEREWRQRAACRGHATATFYIPPGHDGWTVGSEPAVILDVTGMENYAKPT
jgi:hypothetical protein